MRILVHDFSGHPFQVDLSRRLAGRGHTVLHVHCSSYATGKGRLGGDRASLQVLALSMKGDFARYSPARRLRQEIGYGRRFTRLAQSFRPDVVLSCNEPLLAKAVFGWWSKRTGIPWVYWLQDLYSVAISRVLAAREVPLGRFMGRQARRLERWLLQQARSVVAITDDFVPVVIDWGLDPRKVTVIENWAPLDELPMCARENKWRSRLRIGTAPLFLYSGTLGLKHNPDLLYELALHVRDRPAHVAVVSQGMGAERLTDLLRAQPLPNLHLLPFQPYSEVPDMLGASDILLVLLEPDAGVFSVPSKVLTSLCAGRPILGVIPKENLAARTIDRSGGGMVVPPGSRRDFLDAADRLLGDPSLRDRMGTSARSYAQSTFDGDRITDEFEDVLVRAAKFEVSDRRLVKNIDRLQKKATAPPIALERRP